MTNPLVLITGITGHVGFKTLTTALHAGYRVRAVVRGESQIETIRAHVALQTFAHEEGRLSFAIVPDFTVGGGFDAALKDVTYVLHIASPIVHVSKDPNADYVKPAVRGTVGVLESAAKTPSVRRVVITSSVVAIAPVSSVFKGDAQNTYNADSRISPLPTGPYANVPEAYCAAKSLALAAAESFVTETNPPFSVVHIMPSFIFGANDLVSEASAVATGSNSLLMRLILGQQSPVGRVGTIVHVDDVARIHIEALDEKKVPGNASFILSVDAVLEDALEIAKRVFAKAVADGRLPLGGKMVTLPMTLDVRKTVDVFGPMLGYEEMVRSVVGQYLELLGKP